MARILAGVGWQRGSFYNIYYLFYCLGVSIIHTPKEEGLRPASQRVLIDGEDILRRIYIMAGLGLGVQSHGFANNTRIFHIKPSVP